MPFERFRFLSDDHDPADIVKQVSAQALGFVPPTGFAYVGTVYKGKEGAAGVVRPRVDAQVVRVTLYHSASPSVLRTYYFDAGVHATLGPYTWQMLNVQLVREVQPAMGGNPQVVTLTVRGWGTRHIPYVYPQLYPDRVQFWQDPPHPLPNPPAFPF